MLIGAPTGEKRKPSSLTLVTHSETFDCESVAWGADSSLLRAGPCGLPYCAVDMVRDGGTLFALEKRTTGGKHFAYLTAYVTDNKEKFSEKLYLCKDDSLSRSSIAVTASSVVYANPSENRLAFLNKDNGKLMYDTREVVRPAGVCEAGDGDLIVTTGTRKIMQDDFWKPTGSFVVAKSPVRPEPHGTLWVHIRLQPRKAQKHPHLLLGRRVS